MKISNKPILLVEDDHVDIMTIQRALREIHVANTVVSMENGEAALDYLRDPAPVDDRRFVEMMRSIDLYWTIGETP